MRFLAKLKQVACAATIASLFLNLLPAPVVSAAPAEVAIHVGVNPTIIGARWAPSSDSTAASGKSVLNANKSEAKIGAALAAPASYLELTFNADANTPYHLWIRAKAQNNDYNNDSIYVQFSDSLNASGAADYRIGTAASLGVVLEDGSGAGISGWGWADNNYGGLGANIKFANSGNHTVRIQQREDGISIDQIVLSPSAYLSVAPGAAKNDPTILSPSSGSSATPAPTPTPTPTPAPAPEPAPSPAGNFKIANWNVKSGMGVCLSTSCPFDPYTANCTNPAASLNAWGIGFLQQELAKLNADPSVIALGLQEAWACGNANNVRDSLGWKYNSGDYNGVSLVARHGLAGSLQVQKVSVDGSGSEPRYILGGDVCVTADCSSTARIYTTHLGGYYVPGTPGMDGDLAILPQMQNLVSWVSAQPQASNNVIVGDFNLYDPEPLANFNCEGVKISETLPVIRNAGYVDAWKKIYGDALGMTAIINRNGCGMTNGGPFKRIDYGWSKGYSPVSFSMFGNPPVGSAAPSDHYGIIVEYSGSANATPTPTPTPAPTPSPTTGSDIVLHAIQGKITGTRWILNNDSSAADGKSIYNPNNGEAKLSSALANPTSYVEFTFQANSNTPYHIWFRMRGLNNDYANDSVFAQFSDSINLSGAVDSRIGTSSAQVMFLEEGSNAGLSGWGWNDNSYGLLGANIMFATTGTHTIRIQQREDGAAIDQIVLSPLKYLTLSPGILKNDTTILAPAN